MRVLGVVPCSWVYLVSLLLLYVSHEIFKAVFTSACLSCHFSYKKCRLKTGAFWLSPPYLLCHFSMTGSMTVISTLTFSSIQLTISTIHSSSIRLIKGMSRFLCPFFSFILAHVDCSYSTSSYVSSWHRLKKSNDISSFAEFVEVSAEGLEKLTQLTFLLAWSTKCVEANFWFTPWIQIKLLIILDHYWMTFNPALQGCYRPHASIGLVLV